MKIKNSRTTIISIFLIVVLLLFGFFLYQYLTKPIINTIRLVVTEYGTWECNLEYSYIDNENLKTEKKVNVENRYEQTMFNIKEIKIRLIKESHKSSGAKYVLFDGDKVLKTEEIRDSEEEIKMEYKF